MPCSVIWKNKDFLNILWNSFYFTGKNGKNYVINLLKTIFFTVQNYFRCFLLFLVMLLMFWQLLPFFCWVSSKYFLGEISRLNQILLKPQKICRTKLFLCEERLAYHLLPIEFLTTVFIYLSPPKFLNIFQKKNWIQIKMIKNEIVLSQLTKKSWKLTAFLEYRGLNSLLWQAKYIFRKFLLKVEL